MGENKSIGIWIRVSTEDQVKGESPEHHERRARYYAESKEWDIKEVYKLEAVSGKSVMEHPETQRMLSDIKSGKITGIIFSKLARLARNTKELLEFAEIFRKYNADLISLQESIDTSTPAGRLFYTMIAAMAQWEREEIAERVAASVPVRAKMGKPLGGQAPFGYQWLDKKLIPDLKEAPIRKLLYELFIEHQRKKTVARILNESGYRTRNGSKFSDTTVTRLLQDPSAKGVRRANYTKSLGENKKWELKPPSDWVFIEIEPIVSEDIWNQCNAILDEQQKSNHKPAKKAVHLFTGFVFCECDTKMYVPSNSPKYTCQKCHNKIGTSDLESIFHEQLKSFLLSPTEMVQYLNTADQSIREKEELLSTLLKKQSKIKSDMDKLVQLHMAGELPKDGFGTYYKPLDEQYSQMENQIPELQAEIDFLKIQFLSSDEILREAKDLYNRWETFNSDEKRKIIETITERINIGQNEVSIQLQYASAGEKLMTERQHNFIPALPICKLVLTAQKPSNIPKNPQSLGEHIRKRRLEQNLFQKDVACIIGVEETSIYNWEKNLSNPTVKYIPKIIEFLGYTPEVFPNKTLGEKLISYRKIRGLSQKEMALKLGVDPSTLGRIEKNSTKYLRVKKDQVFFWRKTLRDLSNKPQSSSTKTDDI